MASATKSGHPIDYTNDRYWLKSEQSKAELGDFLLEQIAYRRTNPGSDLISIMVRSDIGQRIPDRQMMVNLRQLLFAGNETTSNWLGHIVTVLGTRPDLRAEMAEDRSLVPGALEEMLRWFGVTQAVPRTVCEEGTVIAGVEIPAGAHVMAMVGAAGRDPERYDDPDTFDIRRTGRPHLAFGFGLHSCLGATLARMEALEVANALLDRMPAFRFAAPVTYDSFILRGPSRLLIEKTGN
jgi:cytochrome P450